MKKLTPLAVFITVLLFLSSCNKTGLPDLKKQDTSDSKNSGLANEDDNDNAGKKANAQVALDWYKLQLRILLERNSALNGVYFGYIGIGLYESVRYGTEHSVSLSTKLYQMPAMPAKENNKRYNWPASANAAMAKMVRSFYTGLTAANKASIDSLENVYNEKLKLTAGIEVFNRSQAYGQSIAAAVYNWSLTDNFNPGNTGYVPPVFPGAWVPTPPAFANPINPYYGTARPFMAANLTNVAPAFPAAYSEVVNSDFYKIAKLDYDVSKTLTTEQKNIALFWVDQGNGIGYTPNGHEISLVIQALEQTHASLAVAAKAFAKTCIAQRDALLVVFKSKYIYNLLRPVTYIRKVIDPSWLPFIPTPPHPEYPAAHALVTGAAMQALQRVLGRHVTITDHTYDFRGFPSRTYRYIFKAGEEAGISRLYGGIHYLPSINIGLMMGKDIGNKAGDIKLNEEDEDEDNDNDD
jgi:PAP2 superfamily